jgi:hypothetical protein
VSRVIKTRKCLFYFGQDLVVFFAKTSSFTSSQRGLQLVIRDNQGSRKNGKMETIVVLSLCLVALIVGLILVRAEN